jgi:diadenosine tetraphosphate (Ap4A) HIT family hydrolase
MPFTLHSQLTTDFHVLGRAGTLHLLLRRNAVLPWFLLIPETDALELFELAPTLRRELDARSDVLARLVKAYFNCDKINVAAIGNIVPQLHYHVIGRRRDDCCWPQAAWGHVIGERHYEPAALTALTAALAALSALEFQPENATGA